MADKVEPSEVLRNAESNEQSEEAEDQDRHDRPDEALTRLRPQDDRIPPDHSEQDLAQWRARVDPQRPGRHSR